MAGMSSDRADIIIVPIEIIKEAPLKFIKAAILDALSNISAINDWYYADENINLNTSQSLAINLSKMAASMIKPTTPINGPHHVPSPRTRFVF